MKFSLQYLTITTSVTSAIAASSLPRQAFIYTLDNSQDMSASEPQSGQVSLETAQLILDRRLDTNLRESIGEVSEDTLNILNTFGGAQRPLLADSTSQNVPKLAVALEGWDFTVGGAEKLRIAPTIEVADIQSDNIYDQMLTGLLGVCSFSRTGTSGLRVDVQIMDEDCVNLSDASIFGIEQDVADADLLERVYMMPFDKKTFVRFAFPRNSNDRISTVFQEVRAAAAVDAKLASRETTILVLPTSTKTARKHPLHPRRLSQEEPLTAVDAFSPPKIHTVIPNAASNSTLPISNQKIPHCFASLSECKSGTNECSSHGACTLLHKPTTGDDASAPECWSCSCKATSSGNGQGGIVNWGGNACQKKDISVPFWLFAGFGVSMAAMIAGGIGLLYSMGSQPLPGVLGAGVSGPRAQK